MPMQRHLYPRNWDAIAYQVKQEAEWRCEECGRECRRSGEPVTDFVERIQTARVSECPAVAEFLEKPTRFVLTVAHLDHRPENCVGEASPEANRSNLKALCAPCHCRYDLSQMARKKALKLEREGQLNLFGA